MQEHTPRKRDTWWIILVIPGLVSVAFGLWLSETMPAGCSGHHNTAWVGFGVISIATLVTGAVAVHAKQRGWVVAVQTVLTLVATFFGVVVAGLAVGGAHGCWS